RNRLLGTATTASAASGVDVVHPNFRVRRSRLRSRTARLPANTLGRPGNVVILEDKESLPEDQFTRLVEKDAGNDGWSNPSELLKELTTEKTVFVGHSEVSANFESIRSLHPRPEVLSRTEWAGLREMLRKGFTSRQMS